VQVAAREAEDLVGVAEHRGDVVGLRNRGHRQEAVACLVRVPLLSLQQVIQPDPLIKREIKIGSIHGDKRRRLAVLPQGSAAC
jgi:hypothetical protein